MFNLYLPGSKAQGLALLAAAGVAVAAVGAGARRVGGTPTGDQTSVAGGPVCVDPVEVVDGGGAKLGCASDFDRARCGNIAAGDRVELGHDCSVVSGGMGASLRLLQGLKLDLNRVTASELTLLQGIGPARAAAIVTSRSDEGPFATLEELTRVRGIGYSTVARLRPYLEVVPGRAAPQPPVQPE